MADRSIIVRLGAHVQGLVSGFQTATQAVHSFASNADTWVGNNAASITTLSNAAGIAGAGMTAFAALAVGAASRFDSAMSSVESATHESAQGMAELREAALAAGADTVFSATEAAGAIEELSKAGLSTADIIGGGLSGALDLAAAGEIAVADAAETAATAMVQFGLSGSQVGHVADLLAAGAGKAQGGVTDMSYALGQSGLIAAQMGLSIEETVGTLTAFAAAGLVGEKGGTAFRSMLVQLVAPSAQASALMEKLGIDLYDGQQKFIGAAAMAEQLKTKLGGLSDEQRDQAMATLFSNNAIQAANVLYTQGADGIEGWIEAVDDAGYAAETAAIRLDNLAGDWERLTGSVETALIGMGDGAQGPLRELVQGATDAVDAFSGLPDPVQQGTLALVGSGGLVLLGVAGMGRLAVQVHEAKGAMQALGLTAKTTGIAVASVTAVIAIGAIGFTTWADNAAKAKARVDGFRGTLDEATGATTELTRSMVAEALVADRGFNPMRTRSYQSMADGAKNLGIELDTLTDAILGDANALEVVNAALDDAYDVQYRGATGSVEAGHRTEDAIEAVNYALSSQSGALAEAKEQHAAITKAMDGTTTAADGTQTAIDEYAASLVDGTASLGEFNSALEEQIGLMSEAAGVVLAEEEAADAYRKALDDATAALKENKATLDNTSQAGRDNRDALREIASAGWDQIESMQAAGRSNEELQGQLATTRQDLINAAVSFGMSADEAEAYADRLELVPGNVETFATFDSAQAEMDTQSLLGKINSLPRQVWIDVAYSQSPYLKSPTYGVHDKHASGGLVSGPGTGTSDSVPAWLSNGEYVVRAAAVARYGLGLMDAINTGSWTVGTPPPVRMASGGMVSSRPSGPLVQIGQIVAYDADDAARRIADRQRDILVSHNLAGIVL